MFYTGILQTACLFTEYVSNIDRDMRLMRVSPGRIGPDWTFGTGRKHATPHMEMTNQAVNAQLDAGGNENVDERE